MKLLAVVETSLLLLECPTGSGKSAIAISIAMTLGNSYILVGSKELQSQYARDFPFVRTCKGKNNFRCEVKDDFIKNGTFVCKPSESKITGMVQSYIRL